MTTKKNRLVTLIICLIVAFTLAVFAACKPENGQQATLDHIQLDTANVKTEFTVGDTFTYQGLAVTAVYDDGASAIVTGYTVTANGLDANGKLTAESNEATVSYTEKGVTKTATYEITVTEGGSIVPDDKTVVSIEITKEPTTTLYYVGETFTTDGMEIKVTYDDGTTANLTTGFNASASTAMAGEKSITVTYAGKTDTFTITVYDKLTALAIDGKRAYSIGDEFEGVTVTALYNNKTSGGALLDADDYTLEISPAITDGKFSATGAYEITVTYGEELIAGRPMSVSQTLTVNVLSAGEYALVFSTEADYVANADLVGKWVYYHTAEENGAEIGSKANGMYIADTAADDFDSVVMLNFTDNVNSWWCTQLFYKNPDFTVGSRYTVKLTLWADFSGSITINGNVYALEQEHFKSVEFTITQGAMATLNVQLGVENGNIVAAESGTLAIANISFEKINGESGGNTGGNGNTGGGGGTVETAPYLTFFDPNIIGVWFRTSTLTQDDFASAELLVNGEHFATAYEVQTGGGNFRPMFNGIFGLAGSADGTKYTLQVKVNGAIYDPIESVGGGPHTSGGNTYSLAVESGKLILTVKGSSSSTEPSNPGGGNNGGGTTTPPTGGDGYVLNVTNVKEYGATYVELRMTDADFELLKTATTVVINSTFTGGLATKGFEVVGANGAAGYVNVQLAEGPTDETTFVIEFYNGSTLIATYTFIR